MLKKTVYRLGNYRITEYQSGVYEWETHFDFGKQRNGECFIQGNILILMSWSGEKDGLLIGEFLDQVKKLPYWNKTLYYCFASELLDTSGSRMTLERLKQIIMPRAKQRSQGNGRTVLQPGSFRINRYRLIINEDQTISWQTPRGVDSLISGKGRIESGILFLGPMEGDEIKQNKHEFLYQLSRLPQWPFTKAWCRYDALRSCLKKEGVTYEQDFARHPVKVLRSTDSKKITISPENHSNESTEDIPEATPFSPKSLRSYCPGANKLKWSKLRGSWLSRKVLWIATLIFLLWSGLIFIGIIVFHEWKEKSHGFRWYKKFPYKHRGELHSRTRLWTLFPIFLLSLFLSFSICSGLEAEEKHMILEGSGIHYPAGFDLNTVGEVRGFVSHFDRSGKGPVHFLLSTDRGPYKVLTCPSWYWDQNGFQLAPGAEVIVRGSKSIGNDGRLYLIAQELHIPSSGRFFVFRNKEGIPLWSGHFRSQEERPGWKGGFRERGNLGSGGGRGGHGRK